MDQSLEPIFTVCVVVAFPRFNPYFSGSVTGTTFEGDLIPSIPCFNPYFSGSVTGTCFSCTTGAIHFIVSILILVDQSLELFEHRPLNFL